MPGLPFLNPMLLSASGGSSTAATLALAGLLVAGGPVAAQDEDHVLILLSSRAKPYQQAAARIASLLPAPSYRVDQAVLEDLDAERLKTLQEHPPRAVIAVGSRAAVKMNTNLPAEVALTYCMVSNPEQLGLGDQPRVRGVAAQVPKATQFRIITEALPDCRTLGLLYRASSDTSRARLRAARAAIPKGIRLEPVNVDRHESIGAAIKDLVSRDIDLVWTAPDPSVYTSASVRALLLQALRRRIPVYGYSHSFVRAGALLGAASDPDLQGRQAADLAILQIKAATSPEPDAPPTSPATPEFHISVNLVVAKHLSMDLPEKFLAQAKHVIRAQ